MRQIYNLIAYLRLLLIYYNQLFSYLYGFINRVLHRWAASKIMSKKC
jgi:hypothetical protein